MGGGLKAVLSLWAFLALVAILIAGIAWNTAITTAIVMFVVFSFVAYVIGEYTDG